MGLFDREVRSVLEFLTAKREQGSLRELDLSKARGWPEETSLILSEDTVLELGHPLEGSLAFIIWTADDLISDGADLVGPDLHELGPRAPLGQVIMVSGDFAEEYDCYRQLKDAVYGVKLKGLMPRAMPSRQTFWYRVNREAREEGLSLAHLGAALLGKLKAVPKVRAARVIFITSGKGDLELLADAGHDTGRIAAAMVKMYEEMNYDCSDCEYSDVCGEVGELKAMREKLNRERSQ
jgi:CO dehydrogenase/acetyl-CoA synthase beta subunit